MALALGPCMIFAPLVAVLAIVAVPLWPVALALLLVAYLVTWPLEQLCRLLRVPAFRGASGAVWRWLRWMSAPWNWFDLPDARADEPRA